MISNFEPAWGGTDIEICSSAEGFSNCFDKDSLKSNVDRKDSVRSFIEKNDLIYKANVPATKGKVQNLGSLGKYFGCEFMDSKKVRQEFLNLYKKEYFIGQLSSEESQTSTPVQRVSVYIGDEQLIKKENVESINSGKSKAKNVKKSVNIKKCPENSKLLQSCHSFSPVLTPDSHLKSIQSSRSIKVYKADSFNSSPDLYKSSRDHCTKPKIPNTQKKSPRKAKLDSTHSTISLFQQSFNDLSKINSPKDQFEVFPKSNFSNYLVQSPDTLFSKPCETSKSKSPTSPICIISSTSSPLNQINASKKTSQALSSISLSPKSSKILIQKFTKEFNSILPESLQDLSYLHFLKVLKGLKMITESSSSKDTEKLLAVQMWESLSQQGKLGRSKLLCNLLAIMKLKPFPNNSNSVQVDLTQQHQKYFLFYSNRISNHSAQSIKSSQSSAAYSFKPNINHKSNLLASNTSTESTRTERLYEKIPASHKTLMAKEIKQKAQEEQCTFTPNVYKLDSNPQFEGNHKATVKAQNKKLAGKGINRSQALFGLALQVQGRNVNRKKDLDSREEDEVKSVFGTDEDKDLRIGSAMRDEGNKEICECEDFNVDEIELCSAGIQCLRSGDLGKGGEVKFGDWEENKDQGESKYY